MDKKTIDLGISGEGKYYGLTQDSNDYKKKHYPVLHISGVELPETPSEFYATVKLCKRTETKDYKKDDEDGDSSSYSFDVKEICVDCEGMESEEKEESKDVGQVFLAMVTDSMNAKKKS